MNACHVRSDSRNYPAASLTAVRQLRLQFPDTYVAGSPKLESTRGIGTAMRWRGSTAWATGLGAPLHAQVHFAPP